MATMSDIANVTDISVIVLVVLGILGGARRGLSGELTRLLCIAGAFLIAWKMFPAGSEWLSARFELSTRDLNWIAFAAIAALAFFGLNTIRHALRLVLGFSFKGKLELIGGAILGLARSLIFCIVVLFAAALIPSEPVHEQLVKSYSGSTVIEHLVPVYEEWAEENPDFQLPDLPPIGDVNIESVPWDDYLGPLVDDAREDSSE